MTRPTKRVQIIDLSLPSSEGGGLSLWRGMIVVPRRWTMDMIARRVCAEYGVSMEDLRGQGTHRAISIIRQHAMWLMCQQPKANRSAIGRYFGRCHATVLHGERVHERRVVA